MGLNQSLYWIAEPSKSQVKRLRHKNLSEWDYTIGMAYVSEADFRDERYKYIRKVMIPEEVYYWRNNYEIQDLFNTSFSDVWCEHKKKYEVINNGYYPIVDLLEKMQLVDSNFAGKYCEGTENIFYESNW